MILESCLVYVALVVGQFPPTVRQEPSDTEAVAIRQLLDQMNEQIGALKQEFQDRDPIDRSRIADIEVMAKAADWCLRHHEFFEPKYASWAVEGLNTGLRRAADIRAGQSSWFPRVGSTVLGYVSTVDGSVQPYAVTLPFDYDPSDNRRWPLHVELHGRGANLNEVRFIHQYDGQPAKEELTWIQLDVFGRTNNAYRWAGETDVFEAIAALKQRVRIDDDRIVLRGFSMGGAGAWHLGLHHPSLWVAVGAGAGFVDTVHHLKLTAPLSPLHQKLTRIYDAQEYALNAFNVPVIGYGGDLDPQLFAAKTMHERGATLGVPIPLLVGPETAHKFHPDSLLKFMSFLAAHTCIGRPAFPQPNQLKFTTYSVKYNRCEWLTVEEQIRPYEQSIVTADVNAVTRTLNLQTENIAVLQVRRDIADVIVIDGEKSQSLRAEGTSDLPSVHFEKGAGGWQMFTDDRSRANLDRITAGGDLRKWRDLQGPIDDAFMQPFVCVLPTRPAWSKELTDWSKWTFDRFEGEFDHRMRGKVRTVSDTDLTDELLRTQHLVLFGDPGSNAVLEKVVDQLPLKWTRDSIEFLNQVYPTSEHGVFLIFPNPLNPLKYVVINSGHTFHEREFVQSNANLYPRLGDYGVIKFDRQPDGSYRESVLLADVFDARWRFEVK